MQPEEPEPLRQLRQEFADALFGLTSRPDLLTASRELALRATRDPAVARLVAPLNAEWRVAIARIVAEGQRTGVFRRQLEPEATAAVVVAALGGWAPSSTSARPSSRPGARQSKPRCRRKNARW